uniref:Fatty acid desaturase domain-containing protein n=1 Tax=Anopheles coluzzii TaxID=1518534 RepID=A0A6E8W840_ANOCL
MNRALMTIAVFLRRRLCRVRGDGRRTPPLVPPVVQGELPLRIILMCCYSIAGQNTIYDWVRDHRIHHKYSETNGDPHNANRGFLYAHVGWLMLRASGVHQEGPADRYVRHRERSGRAVPPQFERTDRCAAACAYRVCNRLYSRHVHAVRFNAL